MTSAPWSTAQRMPADDVARRCRWPCSRCRRSRWRAPARRAARASGATPGDAAAVVGGRRGDAGDVGAVAVVVLGRAVAPGGVAAGADAADRARRSCWLRSSWWRSMPESTMAMVMPVAAAPCPRGWVRRCARGPTAGPARTPGRWPRSPPCGGGRRRCSEQRRSASATRRRDGRGICPIVGQPRGGRGSRRRSEPAQDGDDLAEHRDLVGVELHGREAGVGRAAA